MNTRYNMNESQKNYLCSQKIVHTMCSHLYSMWEIDNQIVFCLATERWDAVGGGDQQKSCEEIYRGDIIMMVVMIPWMYTEVKAY